MRTPLPTRRLVRGIPCMLLAVLLLWGQLIAQASAMPAPLSPADTIEQLALQTLCHGGSADQHAPDQAPAPHACLLCPACHLVSHAAVPASAGPVLHPPALALLGRAAPLPPATAPPARARRVAQPTGPPAPPV